jgi:hypothetical protein
MDVGDLVKVKATGHLGTVMIMEGIPARRVYLDLYPGADNNYVYFRMIDMDGAVNTMALNPYDVDELEI